MKPYIAKFQYFSEDKFGQLDREDMFLCLNAEDRRAAREKFVAVTGGESRQCFLVSITGPDKIEAFWDRSMWTFTTVPD
jgi:hypothetical protein